MKTTTDLTAYAARMGKIAAYRAAEARHAAAVCQATAAIAAAHDAFEAACIEVEHAHPSAIQRDADLAATRSADRADAAAAANAAYEVADADYNAADRVAYYAVEAANAANATLAAANAAADALAKREAADRAKDVLAEYERTFGTRLYTGDSRRDKEYAALRAATILFPTDPNTKAHDNVKNRG